MISDLLYRWMYRREIRERRERMAAFADEMEQRMAEARARSAQVEAECAAFLANVKAASARGDVDEVRALFDAWTHRGERRRESPPDKSWLQVEET